jgi:YVTN family beta-propeller protein
VKVRTFWAAVSFFGVLLVAPAFAQVAIVLNSGDGTVSIIDKAEKKEVKRIPVGKEPHHLMATPDDQFLIVANAVSNDLVLQTRTRSASRRIRSGLSLYPCD